MNCLIITFPNHEVYTYLKLIVDNFSELHGTWTSTTLVLIRSARELPARPVPAAAALRFTKKWEKHWGVWEFGTGIPAAWWRARAKSGKASRNFWRKIRVLGVWAWLVRRIARPGATGTYPQVIHKKFMYREFGSLKLLDTNLGPRDFLRTTRALETRCFGRGPWFYSRETIWPRRWPGG